MAELYLALHRSTAGFEKLVVIKRALPIFNYPAGNSRTPDAVAALSGKNEGTDTVQSSIGYTLGTEIGRAHV